MVVVGRAWSEAACIDGVPDDRQGVFGGARVVGSWPGRRFQGSGRLGWCRRGAYVDDVGARVVGLDDDVMCF